MTAPDADLSAGFFSFLHRAGARIRLTYVAAMGLWAVIHGLPLAVGLVIAELIDDADGGVDGRTWSLLGLTVGLMLLRGVLLWGGLALTFSLIFQVSSWLKVSVLNAVLGAPVPPDAALRTGDVVNRLREDTDEIGGLLEWTTDLVYRSVLTLIAVVVLLRTDVITTLPLILLLGGLWASVYLKRRVGDLQQETRMHQGDISAAMTDLLAGVRDLRLSALMPGRVSDLTRRFDRRRRAQVRQQVFTDLMGDLFRNTVVVGTAVVLLTVSVRIADGDFTIGKLVLFLTYIAWLGEQMYFFGYILARLQSGRVSYGRLGELVPVGAGTGDPGALEPLTELVVTDLTCAPPLTGAAPPEPITFAVRPGQLVVITGGVGTGKSTLVRCLLGTQPGIRGSVRWNGIELVGRPRALHTPMVSLSRQSPRFLAGPVLDNLRLGSTEVSSGQVNAVLEAVRLGTGESGLPEGPRTVLDSGEAGQMSGGQRQRLALARMLAHPAQLYVVDDCDSSLDQATAQHIWRTLPATWPGAWVVVSHNRDLLAAADLVVTVDRPTGHRLLEDQ
ncbi:ATP-binding cassette domain-containing protein [Kineosporia succinea]|uniref:ATP-binding cassette subfamily B protein n=1 Tax=Kineosporia succinea TaxID=84632 RepID=A0ABT9PDG5_9ACTN|nr:ABC transporter ATP-binding protein [Kineosporia succinea]MDP9830205.1 ATP-binding cassette subfamily B protein [Kineosporia succinea]